MGLDLTIAPITFPKLDWWLASNKLQLDRHRALFNLIKELPSESIPSSTKFDWYTDDGIQRKFDDCYGKPLRFVIAVRFSTMDALLWNTKWNLGILKFLRTIEMDTPVVLYWH